MEKKFVWVGRNRKFNYITVSDPMTTEGLLKGDFFTFFSLSNRDESGNCEFMMEIFEGDNLIYYSKNSQSSMDVICEDGIFYGQGPFNKHPLQVYFNSEDFISMEINPIL